VGLSDKTNEKTSETDTRGAGVENVPDAAAGYLQKRTLQGTKIQQHQSSTNPQQACNNIGQLENDQALSYSFLSVESI
jgi:hypothetical protein